MKGKILKTILAVLSCACLGFGFAACDDEESSSSNSPTQSVVFSTSTESVHSEFSDVLTESSEEENSNKESVRSSSAVGSESASVSLEESDSSMQGESLVKDSSFESSGERSSSVTNQFVWEQAGNGCGSKIPEPTMPYKINASSTYISAEVHNITEDNFYDYVDNCRDYGFDGTVSSAMSPDLYYMGRNAEGYYLEVFYYENEEYFSIYIRPPLNISNNSSEDSSTDSISSPSNNNSSFEDNQNNNSSNNGESSTNNDTSSTTNSDLIFAKNLAEESHLSQFETKTKLIEGGYSLTEAEELTANCGVNWNKQAVYRAENFAEYYATVSPSMVIDLLLDCEFTNSQAEYAIENCDIDWKYYAVIHAESYLYMGDVEVVTPLNTKTYLEWDKGYSVEDSEYAVNNCAINWNNQALLYLEYVDEIDGPYETKKSYITALESSEFLSKNIQYALENCDINWFLIAESELEILYENNFIWIAYCPNHGAFIDEDDTFMCNLCGSFAASSTGVFSLTKEDIQKHLTLQGYSNTEITYAFNKINYDDSFFEYANNENQWMATYSLERFLILSDIPPTRAECTSALESYGFNSLEIDYALSQFDDSYYAD